MRPTRFCLGALLLYGALPLAGQVSPELARFLQLTPEQASAIDRLAAAWHTELQSKSQLAGQIRSTTGTAGTANATLESICREATAGRDAWMQKTRALLNAEQLSKLQRLEDALNLFPRVLEAQRAGLLADFIGTSPVGMPGGQITVALALTAGPPQPLPGCPPAKTEARPGTVIGR